MVYLQHLYSAALFWADKVVSLSNEDPKDVCTLAHCMYLMKQYHRAAHVIRSRGLEKVNLICRTFDNIIMYLKINANINNSILNIDSNLLILI